MGSSHARGFVAEGAKVIMTDITVKAGAALAAELGSNAYFVEHDVTSRDDWRRVVCGWRGQVRSNQRLGQQRRRSRAARHEDGRTAGGGLPFGVRDQPTLGIPRDASHDPVDASVRKGLDRQHFIHIRHGRELRRSERSLTSPASCCRSWIDESGLPSEYARNNIRVNCVHPGFIMTPMMVEATNEEGGDALSMIPLRRIADPQEVEINFVLFLASDESSYITGSEHVIDAGMTAHLRFQQLGLSLLHNPKQTNYA